MVEQWIVGPKVAGSNPSIYPFMQIEQKSLPLIKNDWLLNKNKLQNNNLIIALLTSNWNYFLPSSIFLNFKTSNPLISNYNKNPFYNNFSYTNLKLSGIVSNLDYNPSTTLSKKSNTKITTCLKKSLLQLFTSFIKVNMSSVNELTIPHHTFRMFYITQAKGGVTTTALPKIFQRWKNFYFLLFNIYYHKIETLTFSPSFFKKEVLALNWFFHKQLTFMWRYVRPFLIHKPNKISNHGDFVFRNLRTLGLSVGIVTDVLYHAKTIYYLKRKTFYSIGLVPTIYNAYTVDFALPTAYESIFTQIFFIRFLIRIKQDSSSTSFNNFKTMWHVSLSSKQHLVTNIGQLDTTSTSEIYEI